jgi:hypothetical protein
MHDELFRRSRGFEVPHRDEEEKSEITPVAVMVEMGGND